MAPCGFTLRWEGDIIYISCLLFVKRWLRTPPDILIFAEARGQGTFPIAQPAQPVQHMGRLATAASGFCPGSTPGYYL